MVTFEKMKARNDLIRAVLWDPCGLVGPPK